MCTVTYIPLGIDHFLITSNRDEQPARSSKELVSLKKDEKTILFPKDAKAGGTWIAAASSGQCVCLLNGAFVKHKHQPPYKRSRGIMVLDYFSFENTAAFLHQYDFEDMEPFTMIIRDGNKLTELRFDGYNLSVAPLKREQSYIWSSATLYDQPAQEKRQQWFNDWKIRNLTPEKNAILDFHRNAGDGDPGNDVVMNRNNVVQTVSITCFEIVPSAIYLDFFDLLSKQNKSEYLEIRSKLPL